MSIPKRPFRPAPFRPARGLSGPHVQSIAGKVLRPRLDIRLHRERIETPDGDFLDLDFAGRPPDDGSAGPIVVVLHGLEGSTGRRYMMTTYRALLARGLRPVGMNFRGCSGEPNRTARAYHSGETGDLRLVLERLRDRFGEPSGVVGYSLGGNVTLKLMGELGGDAGRLVSAAVALSVPFDLAAGADAISSGFMGRRVYTRYFMRNLLRKMAEKRELVREHLDPDTVLAARSIREFDEHATARLHGFDGADDYYARSSSAGFIEAIRVPTLVIHSMDDPFLPADRVPVAALESNPAVTPVLTERGGHVGFIGGSILRPTPWAEGVLADFLALRLTPPRIGVSVVP
jgi:predicted alpha/beta-fold hydrolase